MRPPVTEEISLGQHPLPSRGARRPPEGPPPGFRVTLGIKAFGVAKILVRSPEVLALTHCYPPRPPEGPRMGAPRGGGGVVPCRACANPRVFRSYLLACANPQSLVTRAGLGLQFIVGPGIPPFSC